MLRAVKGQVRSGGEASDRRGLGIARVVKGGGERYSTRYPMVKAIIPYQGAGGSGEGST